MLATTLLSAIEASAKCALEIAEDGYRKTGSLQDSKAAKTWAETAQILAHAAGELNYAVPLHEPTVPVVEINLDGKTIAQSVLSHTLRQAAQGTSTLTGGGLVAGRSANKKAEKDDT